MRKRKYDVRKAQHDVDGAHDGRVDPAGPPRGDHTERHPDEEGDRDPSNPDAERRAGAHQDAAEDVAPELVGSKPVSCGGRLQRGAEILPERILRRQSRTEDGEQQVNHHERQPDRAFRLRHNSPQHGPARLRHEVRGADKRRPGGQVLQRRSCDSPFFAGSRIEPLGQDIGDEIDRDEKTRTSGSHTG